MLRRDEAYYQRMARLLGLLFVLIGVGFFLASSTLARARVGKSAATSGLSAARSDGWLRFHTWQNRVVSVAFVIGGALVALGLVELR